MQSDLDIFCSSTSTTGFIDSVSGQRRSRSGPALSANSFPCFAHHVVCFNFLETKPGKPPVHKVIEGDNFLYVCNATETSQVEIFWTKNDTKHQYRENGTELKFINIDRTFAGDYICYSVNLTVENETEANATLVEGINIDVLCKY